MKHAATAAALAALLALALLVGARAGASLAIDWYRVAGGGGVSSGGAYVLDSTIGQHEAGQLSGGEYVLVGGFQAGAITRYDTYLPLTGR
jgi:hypothetical protein